ncbi:GntR family transcriptional regulator [Bradyrhizobium sp. UNPF46]|uniref:GntR family transcriptional regulator n=1 Tax=Bradyrhizobium sp. UNPF46 TaxID=1141168 RepID=UPI0024BF5859|nr:GntR family transcriptional regulator [Bradyrhizobium sp. UNPF46]
MAAEFGVSHTPVREALKVLVSQGLAVLHHNRGCFVSDLSSDRTRADGISSSSRTSAPAATAASSKRSSSRPRLETRGRFVVESTPSAIALASDNVGAAILLAAMNATSVATGLVEVPLVDRVLYRTIALVRRRNDTLSPAASALYGAIKIRLSSGRR